MSKYAHGFIRAFVLAAALAAWLPVAAQADCGSIKTLGTNALTVCLYSGFKPFAYKEGKDWKGWDVEFLTDFATKALSNCKPVLVDMDFDDIWLRPGQDKCDIAATGISDTAERRKATGTAGCWSKTYYGVLRTWLVRTQDYAKLKDIRDLRGRTAIVTQGSTANVDLCFRMKLAGLHPCQKADGDHPCYFNGLQDFTEVRWLDDSSCVYIGYPPGKDEQNAATDIAKRHQLPDQPTPPFAYGGGYGSIQTLICGTPGLALIWPHCNMGNDFHEYSEPFSFVVRNADTGLLEALNSYIGSHPYSGTVIPDLGCEPPPWTADPPCGQ